MASDVTVNRRGMEQLRALRQPNLQILADSNRQPVAAEHIPIEQRQSIITVERTSCRWPIGDPQEHDFYLCGAKTNGQDSYCAHHTKIAYTPANNKPKRAA